MQAQLDESKMFWVGISLPFRDINGNYSRWPYEALPPCPEEHEFVRFQTIEDVKEEYKKDKACCLPMNSPNAAYFDFDDDDEPRHIFYRDQQDCVIWCLDSNGVYLFDRKEDITERLTSSMDRIYVAKSLGEFLWRIKVEDACWFRYRSGNELDERDLIYGKMAWDPKDDCERYIDHYLQLYKKTRTYLLSADLGCTDKNIDAYLAWYTYPASKTNLGENTILKLEFLKHFDQMEEEGVLKISNGFFGGLTLGADAEARFNELIEK